MTRGKAWPDRERRAALADGGPSTRISSGTVGTPERGAALVELAIAAPLLLLLLFGIIEAGWLFAQQIEVRHGAREAARVAAVSAPDITDAAYGTPDGAFTHHDVVLAGCDSMDLSNGAVTFTLSSSGSEVGDTATVAASSTYESLTGFLDFIFGGVSVTTTVQIRLEQPQAWSAVTGETCP